MPWQEGLRLYVGGDRPLVYFTGELMPAYYAVVERGGAHSRGTDSSGGSDGSESMNRIVKAGCGLVSVGCFLFVAGTVGVLGVLFLLFLLGA